MCRGWLPLSALFGETTWVNINLDKILYENLKKKIESKMYQVSFTS